MYCCPVSAENGGLFIEPEVFEAPAVVDAVDHRGEPLDIRLPAGRRSRVINDRSGAISASLRSISHTSCLRFCSSNSADCWSISLSISGLQYPSGLFSAPQA